ncbi:MAG TPA: GNAT family N-acetyltransferase [Pyrinomonadaceae bacterium]|nr:GNAT family N-acetyltransferase [Pyrinomonadaceae bacterium]
MGEIVVRPAAQTDLAVLLKFEQAMIEAERPFDNAIRTGGDVRYYDLKELITSADSEIVVAEIENKIVGSGYARIESSNAYLKIRQHSYLGFMYVVPEHRGKGVNRKIVEVLETWSAARGVTELRLEVYVENAAAIRAYDKSGYVGHVLEMRKGLTEASK